MAVAEPEVRELARISAAEQGRWGETVELENNRISNRGTAGCGSCRLWISDGSIILSSRSRSLAHSLAQRKLLRCSALVPNPDRNKNRGHQTAAAIVVVGAEGAAADGARPDLPASCGRWGKVGKYTYHINMAWSH